ncbi:MAG TPA: ribonuclease P protein component 1 [Candidatus Dormibacteraeota bacterium]|nr:ribonuclease P protein component 1 [Candidatus Dormibacteraeota bacterium]
MSPITPQNILRHELIGLTVKVSDATDPTIRGVRGAVVDETKNTLKIRSPRGTLMIPKNIATFRFKLPNGVQVDVDGERLTARPEGRLKTRVKRW